MQSQIREHGEDGKLQPDDFKHSIYNTNHSLCDSKHYICQPDGSKRSILQHLSPRWKNHNMYALGEHDPVSAQAWRTSNDL